jgi:hypothetical protein
LSNVTSTATPFASAKLERHFSSSAPNDLRAAKKGVGRLRIGALSTIRLVVAPFTILIVTQEKGFPKKVFVGRRLDDTNQLVPNFKRFQ